MDGCQQLYTLTLGHRFHIRNSFPVKVFTFNLDTYIPSIREQFIFLLLCNMIEIYSSNYRKAPMVNSHDQELTCQDLCHYIDRCKQSHLYNKFTHGSSQGHYIELHQRLIDINIELFSKENGTQAFCSVFLCAYFVYIS